MPCTAEPRVSVLIKRVTEWAGQRDGMRRALGLLHQTSWIEMGRRARGIHILYFRLDVLPGA
jgi:hypothetical protein